VLDIGDDFTLLRVKDTGLWSPIQPPRGAFAKAIAQKKIPVVNRDFDRFLADLNQADVSCRH
jgi:hypothetical protein